MAIPASGKLFHNFSASRIPGKRSSHSRRPCYWRRISLTNTFRQLGYSQTIVSMNFIPFQIRMVLIH